MILELAWTLEDGRGQGRYFGAHIAGLLLTNLNQVAIMDMYIILPYKGNIGIISISIFWFACNTHFQKKRAPVEPEIL